MSISQMIAAALAAGAAVVSLPSPYHDLGTKALARFSGRWDAISTYECTINAHEVKDSHSQDRTYHLYFSKPSSARVEIIAGDGKGSAAVWLGGDTVRARRGGILGGIKVTLKLHSPLVTSIRGTAVDEINYGALLAHLKSLRLQSAVPNNRDGSTTLTAVPADPRINGGISKEVYVLRVDGLPVEIDDYQSDSIVKRITLSEIRINVPLTSSVFHL